MDKPPPVRLADLPSSARWTIRLLGLASIALALMCVLLAYAWQGRTREAACFREALAQGETPAVADIDCQGVHHP